MLQYNYDEQYAFFLCINVSKSESNIITAIHMYFFTLRSILGFQHPLKVLLKWL